MVWRTTKTDRLCLSSMVKIGQRIKLFSYDKKVGNLPVGVELHKAESILPRSTIYRLDPNFSDSKPGCTIVQFSDFFRVMLMKYQQGVWLDTDVYLVKQFHPDADKVLFARENALKVDVSALYFPPDNPIIRVFEDYWAGTEIVPEWLGFKRRVWKPFWLKRKKCRFYLEILELRYLAMMVFRDWLNGMIFFMKQSKRELFIIGQGEKLNIFLIQLLALNRLQIHVL
ncbi:hypothetical protein Q649_01056 [Bartonella quintana JK 73]|uniref:Alpha 1,4-glycosyltransferase domain-containing protein n=1 Tax=Bartonella quintana JK 73 TaxID=1402976 RepID=W3TZS6_BARQI|nr:hypothetical protein Q650_01048 [Bartonella quintana JK 73rel]ETS16094.1 hypothetical protein Q649_01056 [Bartonella quintana JK 73]